MRVLLRNVYRAPMLVVSLLVTVMLTGCGSEAGQLVSATPEDGTDTWSPARPEHMHAAGTSLMSGFVTPDGTWLIGRVFPQRTTINVDASKRLGQPASEETFFGWSAALALTGNAATVIADFLEQAERLGFNDVAQHECQLAPRQRTCEGSAVGGRNSGVRFMARSVEPIDADDRSAFVHVSASGFASVDDLLVPVAQEVSSDDSQLIASSAGLPGVGEPFGVLRHSVGGVPVGEVISFSVADGSELVARPLIDEYSSASVVQYSVLAFDKDLGGTVDAYGIDAQRRFPRLGDRLEWSLGSLSIIEQEGFCPGACGALWVTGVKGESEPGYVLIESTPRS